MGKVTFARRWVRRQHFEHRFRIAEIGGRQETAILRVSESRSRFDCGQSAVLPAVELGAAGTGQRSRIQRSVLGLAQSPNNMFFHHPQPCQNHLARHLLEVHGSIGVVATKTQIRWNAKANEKSEKVICRYACLEGAQLSEVERGKSLIPLGLTEHKWAVVELEGSNSVGRMRYGAVRGILVFGGTRTVLYYRSVCRF